MAEYIDREELLKDINDSVRFSTRNGESAELRGVHKIVDRIKSALTVDVVEVVHGEWAHIKDYGGGKCSGHCSVCWTLQEADNPSALKGSFRYCRWCGAKMDGGSDET